MKDVVVYTTNWCPFCRQAERMLAKLNVPFRNVDVTDDDELRLKLVEMSGGRKTVPQIFIGGEAIGGYSDMVELHQKNALVPKFREPEEA